MEINRAHTSISGVAGNKKSANLTTEKSEIIDRWKPVDTKNTPLTPDMKNVASSPGGREEVEAQVKEPETRTADFLFQTNFAPEKIWTFDEPNREVGGKPLIDEDGSIYFGSGDYNFYHIDRDGKMLWKKNLGGDIYSGPAKSAKGNILVSSADNRVYAYSPDGKKMWNFSTDGAITDSPVVDGDGNVYTASVDGKMYALTPKGDKKWEYQCDGTPTAPLLDDEGNLYFADVNGGIHSLDKDGNVRWEKNFEGNENIWETPILGADGKLYGGSSQGKVYCYDTKTGNEEWNVETNWSIDSRLLYTSQGDVIAGNQDGSLYCIDTKKHSIRWKFDPEGFGMRHPVENDMGNIYAVGDKSLYCVSPDGLPLWKMELDKDIKSPLAFSSDRKIIYAGLEDGSVIALRRKDTAEAMQGEKSGKAGKIEEKDGWIIIGGVRLRKRENN
ncbi:MAG: PQQ-binding-like beta-propeller repeat protein [Candidatus Eremiobacteraeota bacterium]|nr:PQQ-binding-like beta-propeller repeat protein [Candidatus Eremiobacteraeota bacterium]